MQFKDKWHAQSESSASVAVTPGKDMKPFQLHANIYTPVKTCPVWRVSLAVWR
jgi:hypothetical protein